VGRTLAEKILLAHTDADDIAPGDFVMVSCDVVMANDLSTPHAARAVAQMGAARVFDPSKVVLVADHFMPAKDTRSAELQKVMKGWAQEQGVTFYDQGRGGIEHTVLVEEGWIVPGSVVAGADSHTCTYGALGSFGTGMGTTDIAGAMAIGRFWQIVPGTILVEFVGERKRFVTGKDLILAVIA
jgi:3-isopropylmalate/(R)-2-methylmalate dehydratase large subunit